MFWLDEIIEDILRHHSPKKYVVTDWKTPSGRIHVGALRGVVIHGCIARGLVEKGQKTTWQYGFDDADPLDSLPIYLPRSFQEFLGKPLALIPSPKEGYGSFGEYYAKEFQAVFELLGEHPKVVYSYDLYKRGVFNEAINIVLDNAAVVRAVYQDISHKVQPMDWLPIQMICGRCGRIGTTRAYGWDGRMIAYQCEKDWVKYTQGCGFEGSQSPFDGNAKLPWRVEWPAKWYIFTTDVEGAGKDHQTKGGSHDMAVALYERVFKKKAPYNIPYEFFLVGGKKMSSSKGVGSGAKEVTETIPPELLRMLMIMTRPNRAINFSPEGDTIPRLYDEYDKAAQEYGKEPKSDRGRVFHYSLIEPEKLPQFHYRFQKVVAFIQMPHIDIFETAEQEKGSVLTETEKRELEKRIEYAKKWLATFAPEELKLTIQKEIPEPAKQLSVRQKKFLHAVADSIESRMMNSPAGQARVSGDELHAEIHGLKTKMGLAPTEAFQAIYLSMLGKPSGPPAGWFLAALDCEFVVERFRSIS